MQSAMKFLVKVFLTIMLVLVNTVAIATATPIVIKNTVFNVFSQFYVNGKLISSPHLIVYENQQATIDVLDKMNINREINMSNKSLKMDLVVKNVLNSKDKIKLLYKISYKNVDEVMHFEPHFIVQAKQNAAMRWKSDSGHQYELRVVVEKA